MRVPLLPRLALASVLLVALGSSVQAGASSTPFGVPPDPTLRTASRTDIEGRFRRTCAATQARVQPASTASVARGCGCYASRTLRGLSETELAAYRETGVFNDTARTKALAAVDACGLKRPV